jgi:FixJ family two-component response regulator
VGRRGHPPEFRRKVLDLVAAGRPIVDVAHDLGISALSIYTWSMFEYLEIRHDRHRRHNALGWLSPIEFATQKKIVAV